MPITDRRHNFSAYSLLISSGVSAQWKPSGVLSGQSIRGIGTEMITPFSERTVHAGLSRGLSSASYDVSLARPISLWPLGFALGVTLERLHLPTDVCAMVHDKSTNARRGIVVQNTYIDPGFEGDLVVEVTNHRLRPFRLPAGYPIAQLVFHWLDCPIIADVVEWRHCLFKIGDRVRKNSGSSWRGHIVGFYSTNLTPIGYCVESEKEPGSVQVYPEKALVRWDGD